MRMLWQVGTFRVPFFKKQNKESQASFAETSPTAGVTLLESDNLPTLTEDVVASIKRTANGEAGTKQARQANESQSTHVQP